MNIVKCRHACCMQQHDTSSSVHSASCLALVDVWSYVLSVIISAAGESCTRKIAAAHTAHHVQKAIQVMDNHQQLSNLGP